MPSDAAGFESDKNTPVDALGAAGAFWSGVMDGVRRPAAGLRQMLGDEEQANSYFRREQEEGSQLGAGFFRSAGGLLGHSLIFLGGATALRYVPGVGKLAPLLAGSALGFMQPVRETDSAGARLMNAGVGAGTMLLIDKGANMYARVGLSGRLFASEASLMIQAGALNTQAESIVRTGGLASLRDTVLGAGSFYATGAAIKGLSTFEQNYRSWHGGAVNQAELGKAHLKLVRGLQVGEDATVVPSFTVRKSSEGPIAKPLLVPKSDPAAQFYNDHQQAIVRIRRRPGGSGTGFFVDESGHIGTAAHVVLDNKGRPLPLRVDLADGRTLDAQILKFDRTADTAVIRVQPQNGEKFRFLKLNDSGHVPEATPVNVMGHPNGALPAFLTTGETVPNKLTGVIRDVLRRQEMLTSASSHPGNSGSPIMTADGKVVAVLTSGTAQGKGSGSAIEHLRVLLDGAKLSGALRKGPNL